MFMLILAGMKFTRTASRKSALQALIVSADDLSCCPSAVAEEAKRQSEAKKVVCLSTLGLMPQRWLVVCPGLWMGRCCYGAPLGWKTGCRVAATADYECRINGLYSGWCLSIWLNGMVQGAYRYAEFKPAAQRAKPIEVIVPALSAAQLKAVRALHESVTLCRDLVNRPAADLGPEEFVKEIRAQAKKVGLGCKVITEAQCKQRKAGGLLAVGAASPRRPRVLVLEWAGGRAKMPAKPWALLGKGITFDTGGLQIKPGAAMELMRKDMGGGATVAAAMLALAQLRGKQAVRAYIPLADNAIDGNAFRPGDILRMADGSTVEVGHTDAEGRLVLADAMAFARQDGCAGITTVATLTGAALIASGTHSCASHGHQPRTYRRPTNRRANHRRKNLAITLR